MLGLFSQHWCGTQLTLWTVGGPKEEAQGCCPKPSSDGSQQAVLPTGPSFPPGVVPSKASLQIPRLKLLGASIQDLVIHEELSALAIIDHPFGSYTGTAEGPPPVLPSGGQGSHP